MVDRTWYYYFDTVQEGPIAESDLISLIVAGRVPKESLVYCSEISSDWLPASEVDLFKHLRVAQSVPTPLGVIGRQQPAVRHKKTRKLSQTAPMAVNGTPVMVPMPTQAPRALAKGGSTAQVPVPTPTTKPKVSGDGELGCCYLLLLLAGFVSHFGTVIAIAAIFLVIGCIKHLIHGKPREAWNAVLAFGFFCFISLVIAGIIHAIFTKP